MISKPSDAYLSAAQGAPFAFVPSGSCLLSIKGTFVSLPLSHVFLTSFRCFCEVNRNLAWSGPVSAWHHAEEMDFYSRLCCLYMI